MLLHYEDPTAEVVLLDSTDVITTSGGDPTEGFDVPGFEMT